MYDELPIYEVEEISLEDAVIILASDNTSSSGQEATLSTEQLH